VVVTAAEGVAARAGLDEGDVLLQLNNVRSRTPSSSTRWWPSSIRKSRGAGARDGTTRFISLRPTAKNPRGDP
jgi:serine protease Do